MGKSILSIHREIEKKAFLETPAGKLQTRIGRFYRDMEEQKKQMPEEFAKRVYEVRDQHEKDQKAFMDRHLQEAKEEEERILFEAQSNELKVIEEYELSVQNSITPHE